MTARLLLIAAALAAAPGFSAETAFRARLLSPISTESSKKGDKFTAQVIAPPEYAGDILDGLIRESKGGAKVKGKAILNFTFTAIHHGGKTMPIQAAVTSVINSKGKQDVDEEGRVIHRKNSLGKAAAGAGVGALIGGLAGGARGAAMGAGIGAAAALVLIEVGTEGAQVSFAPGTEFALSVKNSR